MSENPHQQQHAYDDDEEQYEPPGGDTGGSAPDQSAPDEEETLIWRGKPAQIVNIKPFFVCLLVCAAIAGIAYFVGWITENTSYGLMCLWLLIVPLAYMFWRYLVTRYRSYEITTERLREQVGVLNRRTHEMELYRVRDSHITEPLLYRIIGVGNVVMDTSDRSHPQFTLWAIREPHEVRNRIRERVEDLRAKKRVREVDFE